MSARDRYSAHLATPVYTHCALAMQTLRAGKNVRVEKPMTMDVDQATRLVDEADLRRRILAVDHTFVHTSAVRKMRELTASGDLGDIYYYDSVRVNLGLFQHDVNVVWDLAVHDLSIMDHVLPVQPVAVTASGIGHVPGEPENIAYVTLHFDTAVVAHLPVNWLPPAQGGRAPPRREPQNIGFFQFQRDGKKQNSRQSIPREREVNDH